MLGMGRFVLLHLGEHRLHAFVAHAGGRMPGLRQQLHRAFRDVGAQTVTRFLVQLTVHGHGEVFAGLHQARGQADHPAVQRIAELADEHQVAVARDGHDGYGVGCALAAGAGGLFGRGNGCSAEIVRALVDGRDGRVAARLKARQLGAVRLQALARGRFIYVVAAVGQHVRENVLLDPAVGHLLDMLQLRGFAHGGFLPVD